MTNINAENQVLEDRVAGKVRCNSCQKNQLHQHESEIEKLNSDMMLLEERGDTERKSHRQKEIEREIKELKGEAVKEEAVKADLKKWLESLAANLAATKQSAQAPSMHIDFRLNPLKV